MDKNRIDRKAPRYNFLKKSLLDVIMMEWMIRSWIR